jgi:tRNA A-37 threonylcarbamoyl transferase component Bud32
VSVYESELKASGRQAHTPTIELLPTLELRSLEAEAKRPDGDQGDLIPGAVLRNRYVLEEVIGRGGHCLVFRARDLHRETSDDPDGGRIALKALQPPLRSNARAVERLAREFRQMQRLAHPAIARVFDLDSDGDIWFMTMELIAGQSGAQWLRERRSLGEAMQVIGRLAEGLHFAHSVGVMHGDLKPSNVLITADLHVKLIDFGSAPAQDEPMGFAVATPSYASPQVLAGLRPELRDDVFSLACLSYEILSGGERPFGDQSSLEAYRARLCPAAIAGMPVEVFAVLMRSLTGDREHRAASAAAFSQDLQAPVKSAPRSVSRARGGAPRRAPGQSTRRLRHVSVASVGVAVACSLVLLLPTARKIVAGPEDDAVAAVVTPPPLSAAVNPPPVATTTDEDAPPMNVAPAVRVAGRATFENTALMASSAQSMIAIPIHREQSTRGEALVEWHVQRGSATPDVDYKATRPQVVRFNDGEAVRSIFIPLLDGGTDAVAHAPRTFTVTLRALEGGLRLGAVRRVSVTIVPQSLSDLSNALVSVVAPVTVP